MILVNAIIVIVSDGTTRNKKINFKNLIPINFQFQYFFKTCIEWNIKSNIFLGIFGGVFIVNFLIRSNRHRKRLHRKSPFRMWFNSWPTSDSGYCNISHASAKILLNICQPRFWKAEFSPYLLQLLGSLTNTKLQTNIKTR